MRTECAVPRVTRGAQACLPAVGVHNQLREEPRGGLGRLRLLVLELLHQLAEPAANINWELPGKPQILNCFQSS